MFVDPWGLYLKHHSYDEEYWRIQSLTTDTLVIGPGGIEIDYWDDKMTDATALQIRELIRSKQQHSTSQVSGSLLGAVTVASSVAAYDIIVFLDIINNAGGNYAQHTIDGIRNGWKGTYDNKPVNVRIFKANANSPGSIAVNIKTVSSANDFSTGPIGKMNLFIGDGRIGIDHRYSTANFMSVAAHEFGHSALRLWDVYIAGHPDPDPNITTPFTSIMNRAWGITAQEVDYAILFGNRTWLSADHFRYGSDSATLDKILGVGNW
jgi:hypothetical protein